MGANHTKIKKKQAQANHFHHVLCLSEVKGMDIIMYEGKELSTEEMNVESEDRPLEWKFCWAGFIMPQFWGIGNGLLIGLLAWIPVVFPFIALYFGFAGYESAYYKTRHLNTKEEFRKKQKVWNIISFIYIVAFVSIVVYYNWSGISNYMRNKKELNLIIEQTEEQQSRLIEEMIKLTDAESLKPYIDGLECTINGEVKISDNGVLWRLENMYGYYGLSEDTVYFDQPRIYEISQEFLIEDGRILTIFFSVDENFQLQEGSYSIYSGAELHMVSPGHYATYDEKGLYMDKATINLRLNVD